jgi:hypothetical protein
VVGAAGVDDRRLDLRDARGGVVAGELAGGRAAREAPGEVTPSSAARHLDAVVRTEIESARLDPSPSGLNAARRRVAAAADVLDGGGAESTLAAFDAAVGTLEPVHAVPVLLEVVPVAQRFFGGWLLSVEAWADHWRAVVVREDGAPARRWTASDGDGLPYAAAPIDADVLRFSPGLPLAWTSLRLEGHAAGEVLELVVEVDR